MSITIEVRPNITEIQINSAVPSLKWGNMQGSISNQTDLDTELTAKLAKTTEIQALEAVAVLPGTPDPNTIYFITP